MSAFFANRRSQADVEAQEPVTALPATQPVGFDTVIGANSQTEGAFVSSGNVRIDGQFSGSLEIEGNILVGESAEICADINARNISIAGTVRGNIAGSKVQLLRTGRIWGDICAAALTTEEGAFIDGKITMVGHAATREPAEDELVELDEELPARADVNGDSDEGGAQDVTLSHAEAEALSESLDASSARATGDGSAS